MFVMVIQVAMQLHAGSEGGGGVGLLHADLWGQGSVHARLGNQ